MKKLLLLTTAVLWLLTASCASRAAADGAVLIGYYLAETDQINHHAAAQAELPLAPVTPAQAVLLTHINFAFLDLNAAGECDFEQGSDPAQAALLIGELSRLKQHNPTLRILFSLGGWSNTNDASVSVARYRHAAASPKARSRLAASCLRLLQQYDFDGIDIDWEYPRRADAANFLALLKEFRRQLDLASRQRARPYQLTMAGAGDAFNLARTYLLLPQIAQQLDYLNLMAYDLNGPWQARSNHHAHLFGAAGEALYENPLRALPFKPALSPRLLARRFPSPFALTVDAAVQQYLQAGVPPAKLVLGVPFYGRALFQAGAAGQGLHQAFVTPAAEVYEGDPTLLAGCDSCAGRNEPRLASFAEIRRMLEGNFGYQRYFGDDTKAAWLYHPEQKIFVSYDDAEALRYKTAYLKQQGLAGVMLWRLGQDDAEDTLLQTLHQSLHGSDDSAPDLSGGRHYRSAEVRH